MARFPALQRHALLYRTRPPGYHWRPMRITAPYPIVHAAAAILLLASAANSRWQTPPVLGQTAVERTIDLESESDVVVYGALNKDQLGNDLTTGDLNSDGIADIAVGAHWGSMEGRNLMGRAYVFFGRTTWPEKIDTAVLGSTDWSFMGVGLEPRLGVSISVGDLSGDQVDDVVLGSLLADPPDPSVGNSGTKLMNAGALYLMFGGSEVGGRVDFLGAEPNVLFTGSSDAHGSDQLGTATTLGDFNGDGQLDLAAAASLRQRFIGAVFVFFGPFTGGSRHHLTLEPADWTILGPSQYSYFGAALDAADLDDDGDDDLVVTAFRDREGPTASGAVYVLRGRPELGGSIDLSSEDADATILGPEGSSLGGAMALGWCSCRGQSLRLGDATDDGVPDLIVGAPLAEGRKGGVYVIAGPVRDGRRNVADLDHWHLAGTTPEERLGWSLATGHLDDDGRLDLIAAAPGANVGGRETAGAAYGLRGPLPSSGEVSFDRNAVPLVALGPEPNSGNRGMSVAMADVNGDNSDDLLLGFPDAAPMERRLVGSMHVSFGPLLDTLATVTPSASATCSPVPSATVTATPTATPTPSWTAPPTTTPSPESTSSPTSTASPQPSSTVSVQPTSTATSSPTVTATWAETSTPTPGLPDRRYAYLPILGNGR